MSGVKISFLKNNLATTLTQPAILIGATLLVTAVCIFVVYQRLPQSMVVPITAADRANGQANERTYEQTAEAEIDNQLGNRDIIITMNLFGAPKPLTAPAEQNPENIPQTNLRLALKGAFAHSVPEKASALIAADQSSKAELYYIDAALPGGAKLEEVHPNYVVIRRNGQREKLQFLRSLPSTQSTSNFTSAYEPPEQHQYTPPKSPPVAPDYSAGNKKNHGSMAEIRERIRQRDRK